MCAVYVLVRLRSKCVTTKQYEKSKNIQSCTEIILRYPSEVLAATIILRLLVDSDQLTVLSMYGEL